METDLLLQENKSILKLVSKVATDLNMDHIIIGGWCPYLKYKDRHPGTKDVDILFNQGNIEGFLDSFFTNMIEQHEAMLSAKHEFQLFLKRKIGKWDYIFSVDILHPNTSQTEWKKYVDQLDILVDDFKIDTKKSIILPNSRVLFDHKLFEVQDLDDTKIKIIDANGLFITKYISVQNKKRTRDALDIYLAIISKDINPEIIDLIFSSLVENDRPINVFSKWLEDNKDHFDNSVFEYLKIKSNYSDEVLDYLRK